MNSVFRLQFINCSVDPGLKLYFSGSIMKDVTLFNVPALPRQLRIPVQILAEEDFESHKKHTSLIELGAEDCYAYSDSKIYVLSFQHLKQDICRADYLKVIRHECVHILQHLASKVPPADMVWLYESIACAIAEQHNDECFVPPAWSRFINNFYATPYCYETAYRFGKALLDRYPVSDLMSLSSRKRECFGLLRALYEEVFSR